LIPIKKLSPNAVQSLYSPNHTLGTAVGNISTSEKVKTWNLPVNFSGTVPQTGDAKSVTASSKRPKGAFIAFVPDIY